MKFYFNNENIVVEAQSAKDNIMLLSLRGGAEKKIKHKKHQHVKQCPYCNKGYKGNTGLGRHVGAKHPGLPTKVKANGIGNSGTVFSRDTVPMGSYGGN